MGDENIEKWIQEEISKWRFPTNLVNFIANDEEELENIVLLFGSKLRNGDLYNSETNQDTFGYKEYEWVFNGDEDFSKVAYNCNNCRKIMVGPPRFLVGINLTEKSYVDLECKNCHTLLRKVYEK